MFLNDCLSEIEKNKAPQPNNARGLYGLIFAWCWKRFFVETFLGKANREPSLLAQSRLSLPGQVS